MKLYYDEKDVHYVLLEEVELGQSLKAVFNTSTKELLIVDPDTKDYKGNDYVEKIVAVSKEDGKSIEVGIVQKLTRKTIDDIQNLFDLLELEYSK